MTITPDFEKLVAAYNDVRNDRKGHAGPDRQETALRIALAWLAAAEQAANREQALAAKQAIESSLKPAMEEFGDRLVIAVEESPDYDMEIDEIPQNPVAKIAQKLDDVLNKLPKSMQADARRIFAQAQQKQKELQMHVN